MRHFSVKEPLRSPRAASLAPPAARRPDLPPRPAGWRPRRSSRTRAAPRPGWPGGRTRGGRKLAEIPEVTDPLAGVDQAQGDYPGQDVRQRQEQQAAGVPGQHPVRDPRRGQHGADRPGQVAVADHAALRLACRAGGVHDGGEGPGGHRATPLQELTGGDAGPGADQQVKVPVQYPYRLDRRRLCPPDGIGQRRGTGEDRDRAAVAEDPADLLGRRPPPNQGRRSPLARTHGPGRDLCPSVMEQRPYFPGLSGPMIGS